MPRPGPKPIPTALHQLHGSFNATRHGRDRTGEPTAEGDLSAAAPDWTSPRQQESWAYAMAHAPKGILKAIDRGVLAIWVEAEDRHRTAVQQQAKLDGSSSLPSMTRGKDGQPIALPYLRIIRHAAETMLRAASELGFAAASRPHLAPGQAEAPAVESPWTRLKVVHGGSDAS